MRSWKWRCNSTIRQPVSRIDDTNHTCAGDLDGLRRWCRHDPGCVFAGGGDPVASPEYLALISADGVPLADPDAITDGDSASAAGAAGQRAEGVQPEFSHVRLSGDRMGVGERSVQQRDVSRVTAHHGCRSPLDGGDSAADVIFRVVRVRRR
jgi:hypothetical protein